MSQTKVMTILGTRPEIVRLSRIIPALDSLCAHVLVHTGQNFDPELSDVFFAELGVRRPDHYLGIGLAKSFGAQAAEILQLSEQVVVKEKPDRLLVLGDTNSGLSAIVAKRIGVPVYHMEAGNRCFDDRVPEEINRRIIDHCSDVLLPYTERSRHNLLREGFSSGRILVTGNPIHEVIRHYQAKIEKSEIVRNLGLKARNYFLVTMHRAENVDVEERLRSLSQSLDHVQREFNVPIICSLHPHTRQRMEQFDIVVNNQNIRFLEPLGLFDFIALEQAASCVLTDSGTVQEECCLLHIPAVTIRDTTERPETLECGSNILSGVEPSNVLRCVHVALSGHSNWEVPRGYLAENVSTVVVRVLLGQRPFVRL
jgi:UDP-N-acetylglucosamine 2-epimerase (non-hydrolysing)